MIYNKFIFPIPEIENKIFNLINSPKDYVNIMQINKHYYKLFHDGKENEKENEKEQNFYEEINYFYKKEINANQLLDFCKNYYQLEINKIFDNGQSNLLKDEFTFFFRSSKEIVNDESKYIFYFLMACIYCHFRIANYFLETKKIIFKKINDKLLIQTSKNHLIEFEQILNSNAEELNILIDSKKILNELHF